MHRDPDEGLVLVNADRCIACAMCAIACPFSAVTFHPVAADGNGAVHQLVAVKCDGCVERVRQGEEPACVESCKTGALVYGELNELVAEGRIGAAARTLDAVTAGEADAWGEDDKVTAWRSFGTQLEEIGSR
jgi:carbon-monoxide dehydrogenase iron sulfur subunit